MKKLMISALICFSAITNAQTTFQAGKPAVLTGKISMIKSQHPNPSFYGQKQAAIRPIQTLTVFASGDEFIDGVINHKVQTKLLQLNISNPTLYNKVMKSNNKNVVVYCDELWGAHTAHHTTKVLCTTNRIVFK